MKHLPYHQLHQDTCQVSTRAKGLPRLLTDPSKILSVYCLIIWKHDFKDFLQLVNTWFVELQLLRAQDRKGVKELYRLTLLWLSLEGL